MEFGILGPLECREGERVLRFRGSKQRALLATLLLHANEVVSSDRLLDELWGDKPPGTGAAALQVRVSELRKTLGEGANLATQPPGYVLRVECDELDLFRFEQLVAEAAEAEPSVASAVLRDALALWRGPALADLAYETFAQGPIARLEEERLVVLTRRIDADLELRRHADLIGELEQLVVDHPLSEAFRARLMLALYRSGRQAEALATYAATRKTLIEELGIEPSPPLRKLELQMLRQDPKLDASTRAGTSPGPPAEPFVEASTSRAPIVRDERKIVSILLLEVVSGSGHVDPEDALLEVEPVYAAARREIELRGGVLENVIGDSMIAVFGAPIAHEDDPERAVRAALAIRSWARSQDDGLRIRVAINTGVALVRVDRRHPESPATVAGEAITVAQRLLREAGAGAVLVGSQTYRATREIVEYLEVALAETSERTEPTAAWEALDVAEVFVIGLPTEPSTALVGRKHELELLGTTLARVSEERSAQLVTLVGEPGIGKSRLAVELFVALGQDRELVTWLQGRCLPYGDGVSFWALGEMAKAQAGILESDSRPQAEAKLQLTIAKVGLEGEEMPWVAQHLRPLLGLGGELGPGERSEEAFPAWRRFFVGLADLRPLVLVFEDVHWADEGLLAFVDELVDNIRGVPVFVLCTARPEFLERMPNWGGGKANALSISLTPLSDEETVDVFNSLLDEPRLEGEMREALIARAAGNPLYAEQFARMLMELGSLEELPETVMGIIAARLDGLLPEEKTLLQDAAVVGKVFWPGVLEAIGHRSAEDVEAALASLERKEFVHRTRGSTVARESERAFRHALLRDVAYDQIPRAGRAEKHHRAAAWIEALGRPDDHAEMLAHHYLHALAYAQAAGGAESVLAEKARLWLKAAGDRALALASYASAARSYTKALELWPKDDPQRVWVLADAGRASAAADGTGIDLLEQAFDELRSRREVDGAAEAAVDIARSLWLSGDRDRAYRYVDEALELASSAADSPARAHALVARASYHMLASEHHEAIRLADEALPLTETLEIDRLRVRALDVRGSSRCLLGEVEGLDDSRHAIELARKSNSFSQLITAEYNLYVNEFSFGHPGAASEMVSTWCRDAESYGTTMERRWAHVAEAYDAILNGRWEAAMGDLNQLISVADAGSAHYLDPVCRTLRASIHHAQGRLEEATTDLDDALTDAASRKDPQILAPALALKGIVLLAQGLPEEASASASEVLALGGRLSALLDLFPAATPLEFAWLIRDLKRESELLAALIAAPPTIPWLEAAGAIAEGRVLDAVELATRIGASSVEAYTRLRAAEELAWAERRREAHVCLAPAVAFFEKVGATRFLGQAERVLVGPGRAGVRG